MKTIKAIIISIAAAVSLWSCGNTMKDFRPAAVGSPYELLIVCAQDEWEGELGDTIRAVLTEPVDFINSSEPSFDLMRIMPTTFGDLHRKTRNILNVTTGSQFTEPRMDAQYDVYATPQLLVTLSGPDDKTVTDYVSENRNALLAVYNNAERDWSLDLNRRYGDQTISKEIFEKFGVKLLLPKGYTIRNSTEDFMWISFEYPTASQGIIIYTYPYSDRENFSEEWLLFHRNEFVSKIPGENPGSYMTTFDGFMPYVRYIRIGDRDWAEMRGFWEVEGDFMGGPFANFSTLDRARGNIISFDFYVFSPDKPKRNFLRPLENLVHSISFPEETE